MYPDHFAYFRPRTVAEASALLKKHKGSRVIAGGHSLLPAMKFRLANPKALVDIGGIKGLSGVQTRGKAIWIGATTTHAEVAASPILRKTCPMLAETAARSVDPSRTPIQPPTFRPHSSRSAPRSSRRGPRASARSRLKSSSWTFSRPRSRPARW